MTHRNIGGVYIRLRILNWHVGAKIFESGFSLSFSVSICLLICLLLIYLNKKLYKNVSDLCVFIQISFFFFFFFKFYFLNSSLSTCRLNRFNGCAHFFQWFLYLFCSFVYAHDIRLHFNEST